LRAANPQDWAKIYTGLGLGKETTSALQAFRARHSSAVNKNAALKASATEIDLDRYRAVLKDQSAVQNAEKILRDFKPVDYDVSKWDQAVDKFQGKAVAAAKETVEKIGAEEKSLKETLANIQEARPFEDLTVSAEREGGQGVGTRCGVGMTDGGCGNGDMDWGREPTSRSDQARCRSECARRLCGLLGLPSLGDCEEQTCTRCDAGQCEYAAGAAPVEHHARDQSACSCPTNQPNPNPRLLDRPHTRQQSSLRGTLLL
jgi:F-type H+-transporting ATPase subunit d